MSTLVTVALLGSCTLLILGGLIGHSLSEQLRVRHVRRQAELGRRIGEEWRQILAFRQMTRRCPACGARFPFGGEPSGPDDPPS
jgi:hypothetical protein